MHAQPDLTKAHCNICGGVRSHFIVFEHKEDWREEITDDPRDDITGTDRYELLKCAGCGHVVFRHSATHSQNYDDDGKLKEVITYSPPKQVRKKLSLLSTVAGGIQFVMKDVMSDLLDEIYIALHSECPRIAAMGIRALIEHLIIDKVGSPTTWPSSRRRGSYLRAKKQSSIPLWKLGTPASTEITSQNWMC